MEFNKFTPPETNYPPTIEDIENIYSYISELETALTNNVDVVEHLQEYGLILMELSTELELGTKDDKDKYKLESHRIHDLSSLALSALNIDS